MVRNYKRKTAPVDAEKLGQAILAVQQGTKSVRSAANHFMVPLTTLFRRTKKTKQVKSHTQLFTPTQELSIAREMNFNRHNAKMFFDNLYSVLDRANFEPHKIFNIGETGVTTVQIPQRVVSRRGIKQAGRLTSTERRTLVSITLAVSAIGVTIPPFYVFPRVKFKDHFLREATVGAAGACNPSGWMEAEQFLIFLQHFKKYSNARKDSPVLLLLDNHDSHLDINALDFCKDNGITVISFPSHCTHKMQPLDRSVFGPFKTAMNKHCDYWMRNNPGKTMTIYDIPLIAKTPLQLATPAANILAGFRTTGIYPLNPDIFQEIYFMPSLVTDRPLLEEEPYVENDIPNAIVENASMDVKIESDLAEEVDLNATLESILHFPKASPRKNTHVSKTTKAEKEMQPSCSTGKRPKRGRPKKNVESSDDDSIVSENSHMDVDDEESSESD